MPIFSRAIRLVALMIFWASPLYAAEKPATVAVMPFRDLSGSSKFVGEAIRETVTSDLKQIGSLRVVERGSLDKVLAEQGLKVQSEELDLQTVVKLGKVLGASLIVVGAYQKLAPQVRLTARFVKVETSEIVGTAKVDGSTRDFLRLQDRITAALLHSAGFAVHAKRVLADSEHRPDLSSLKTLELYGQAVVAENDLDRKRYLAAAIVEDKNFSYATKDLEALDKRLEQYSAAARVLQEKDLHGLDEKLHTTTDREAIAALMQKRITLLNVMRRFHTAARDGRAFLAALPAGATVSSSVDGIAVQLMVADTNLRDDEQTLRDGEQFLARAPGSGNFALIKQMVNGVINEKRRREEFRKRAEQEVAGLPDQQRWDLCAVAMRYCLNQQFAESQRLFTACFKIGTHKPEEYIERMSLSAFMAGDWKALKKMYADWTAVDANQASLWHRTFEYGIPVDE